MNKIFQTGILLISTSVFMACNSADPSDHGHEHTEGEEHHEHHEQEEIVLEGDSTVMKNTDQQEMHDEGHSNEEHHDHQH